MKRYESIMYVTLLKEVSFKNLILRIVKTVVLATKSYSDY